jgi:hypothetical protein
MPRKARIDLCGVASAKTYALGALRNIIVRGINRRKIFFDDADCGAFLYRLGDILSGSKTPFFAWALMTNHLILRISKKLNIASSTASESAMRGGQIVETHTDLSFWMRTNPRSRGTYPNPLPPMIRRFLHQGLRKQFDFAATSGIQIKHENRLRGIFANLKLR